MLPLLQHSHSIRAWQRTARRSASHVAAARNPKVAREPAAADVIHDESPNVSTTASNTEAERRASRRNALRGKRGRATKGLVTDLTQYIQSNTVRKDSVGMQYMDRGVLGRDAEGFRTRRTYAVQVLAGSEAKYVSYLRKGLSSLANVDDEGQTIDRTINIRIPEKDTLEFSNRTFKLTKRKKLYGDGGWVFVDGVMDNQLYELITKTYYYQTWHFKAAYQDDEGKLYDIPQPCSDQFLVRLQEWEAAADPLPDREELEEEFFGEAAGIYQELSQHASDKAQPGLSPNNSHAVTAQPAEFNTGAMANKNEVITTTSSRGVALDIAVQPGASPVQTTRSNSTQADQPNLSSSSSEPSEAGQRLAEQQELQQLLAWGAVGCDWASCVTLSSVQQKQHMQRVTQPSFQSIVASGSGQHHATASMPASNFSSGRSYQSNAQGHDGPSVSASQQGVATSPAFPAVHSTSRGNSRGTLRRQGRTVADDVGAFQVDPLQLDEEFQGSTYPKLAQRLTVDGSRASTSQSTAVKGDEPLVTSGKLQRRRTERR